MANHKDSKATKPLTPVQRKVVKKKIEAELTGRSIRAIAPEVFPNSTPESARTMMHRELQNVTVQEALQKEMAVQGIDLPSIVRPVAKALKAKRVVQLEGDFYETDVDDIPTQLKGVQFAAQFMGIGKGEGSITLNYVNLNGGDRDQYGL